MGSYEQYRDGKGTGEVVPYEPYSLVDGRLSWDEKKWSVWLESDNLLNTRYFDHGNIPQPGIWAKVGVIWRAF